MNKERKMTEELRMYSFTNFYLSSIQQGIQPGHAAVELFVKYCYPTDEVAEMRMLYDWAKNWKTFICLNGGDAAGVEDMFDFLSDQRHAFPFAPFHESEQALDGVMTTVTIILPARIFETASLLRKRQLPDGISYTHDKLLEEHRFSFLEGGETRLETFSEWEYDLMQRLNGCGLAR